MAMKNGNVLVWATTIGWLLAPAGANAQRIDPADAVGPYSGGGVTLTGEDLRRIVADDAGGGSPRGGGAALVVECQGAFGFATIQSAIDAAIDGDVVVVLPNDCSPEGRWVENINFVGKAIRVQCANPADPDVVAATTIDGNMAGSVVYFVTGEGPDSVLDGLTLINGRQVSTQSRGGGVTCLGAAPTIRRCVISGNSSGLGSAASIFDSDGPLFDRCDIAGNAPGTTAIMTVNSVNALFRECRIQHEGTYTVRFDFGGFAACSLPNTCGRFEDCLFEANVVSRLVYGATVDFSECRFTGNSAGQLIMVDSVQISDCRFDNNMAASRVINTARALVERTEFVNNTSPASEMLYFGELSMVDCEVSGNEATTGAVIYAQGPVSIVGSTFSDNDARYAPLRISGTPVEVSDCAFEGNTGQSVCGALYVFSTPDTCVIRNCVFRNNVGGTQGGAIGGGGVRVIDTLVAGNVSNGSGGGIRLTAGGVEGCTVVGNRSKTQPAGVYATMLENTIVYDNRVVFQQGPSTPSTQQQANGFAHAHYCNIQNYAAFFPANGYGEEWFGNIDLAPQFVDAGSWDDMGTPTDYSDDVFAPGDYHLRAESPCIDGGNPAFIVDTGAVDIDGEPRRMACHVDIGVDEFTQDAVGVVGDFNNDGEVTLDDVPTFVDVALAGHGIGVCSGDVNGDEVVDGRDVSAIVSLLLGG
ncbi:MAG TPA: right-handed parallel beta-helix repeat-containing protein [Phycisphaerae bacterium]|nr:right-handed parallel beta-helix repeat-containing protein [Phycisphaerae bacterium]HRW52244.1 right-handed parallel beta-helix repeat-containing protein [Phycisphaerae bacterium]